MASDGYKSFSQYSWGGQNRLMRLMRYTSIDEEMDPEPGNNAAAEVERDPMQSEVETEWGEHSSAQDEPEDYGDSERESLVLPHPEEQEESGTDTASSHASNSSRSDAASDDEFGPVIHRCEDDDENTEDENNEELLLYDGAPITTSESMIAILNLSLRHNTSGVLLTDILRLISLHCPDGNHCKTTLHTFKKYFSDMNMPLVRHYYCTACFERLETQNSVCTECVDQTKTSYFLIALIIPQIEALYKRPGFFELLQHRFTRNRQNLESYEDIYDGAVYKDLTQPGSLLADRNNLSFTWYADGIRIFKSSKFNIWVVYFVINELPPMERVKKENVLLVAVWFGDSKPVPTIFLEPLQTSIEELRHGINVCIPNNEDPLIVRAIVICGTCDLPAKAMFLNMTQYNGRFGCQKCKQIGEYLNDYRVRVYPYEQFDLRTDNETLVHAQHAYDAGFAVCGVKGPSILFTLVHESIRATAVDVMHCVFEGVVKSLLNFWFSSSFSNHPSSLIEDVDLVEQRLTSLTPPSSIQRLPRSITQHLPYWKAHEFKNWFFYYSIPCISDIMSESYFEHYKLLVLGISLLCQSSVHPNSLDIASRALNEFVSRFEHMYYLRYMTNNLHQLLHLAENVRQFGPLWTTSCFPYEDLNGTLKRLVHGSNAAQLQICSAISMYLNLSTLKSKGLDQGRRATSFCETLDYKRGRIKRHFVSDSVYIVGKCSALPYLPADIRVTFENADIHGTKYSYFMRLLKNKTMYSSFEYTRNTRTNSMFAVYSECDSYRIGRIRCFIRVADCLCPRLCHCVARHYAILKRCLCNNEFSTCVENSTLSTVHTILNLENFDLAIEVTKLKSICFYCHIGDISKSYVIEPINLVECE